MNFQFCALIWNIPVRLPLFCKCHDLEHSLIAFCCFAFRWASLRRGSLKATTKTKANSVTTNDRVILLARRAPDWLKWTSESLNTSATIQASVESSSKGTQKLLSKFIYFILLWTDFRTFWWTKSISTTKLCIWPSWIQWFLMVKLYYFYSQKQNTYNYNFSEAPEQTDIASLDDFTDSISKEDWDALKQLADTKKGCVDIDVIYLQVHKFHHIYLCGLNFRRWQTRARTSASKFTKQLKRSTSKSSLPTQRRQMAKRSSRSYFRKVRSYALNKIA